MLAIVVSIIATAVLLACLVNPALLFPLFAAVIPTTAAGFMTCCSSIRYAPDVRKGDSDRRGFPIPILGECFYVYKAFTSYKKYKLPTIADRENTVEEAKQTLNSDVQRLQAVQKHKKAIEEGIKKEIKSIDNTKLNADMTRITALRAALKSLEEIDAFMKKIA